MFNIARISDWSKYLFLCCGGKVSRNLLRCPGIKKTLAKARHFMFFHKVAMPPLILLIVRLSLISSTTSGFKSVLVSPTIAPYHYSPILPAKYVSWSLPKRVFGRQEVKLDFYSSLAMGPMCFCDNLAFIVFRLNYHGFTRFSGFPLRITLTYSAIPFNIVREAYMADSATAGCCV